MFTVTYKIRRDPGRHAAPSFATLEEAEADAIRLLENKAVLWARVRDETGKTIRTFVRKD